MIVPRRKLISRQAKSSLAGSKPDRPHPWRVQLTSEWILVDPSFACEGSNCHLTRAKCRRSSSSSSFAAERNQTRRFTQVGRDLFNDFRDSRTLRLALLAAATNDSESHELCTIVNLMPGSWRRTSARFNTSRTSRVIGSLTKSDMSPLKNSRSASRAGLLRLAIP